MLSDIHRTSYRNFLYIPRYQNGRAYTNNTHFIYVTKCSVLCVGHFSYGYGSNSQTGTPAWECKRDRRASETVELREERLCVRRECDWTRRTARSNEEREAALLRMRAYGRSIVASETADERPVCNDYVQNSWMERLAAEPTDFRRPHSNHCYPPFCWSTATWAALPTPALCWKAFEIITVRSFVSL